MNIQSRVVRFLTTILCLIFILSTVCIPASAAVTSVPQLSAQSAVLIDRDSGEVLYDKSKDMTMYPASLTKIMTALLVIENMSLEETVTVSGTAAATEGSSLELKEGEEFTIEQLLYGLMLKSANDAAVALAETVSGSVSEFAELMNERAEEIGAENTNFVSPSGLPDPQHVTTAYDMARIAQEAMNNSIFAEIVSTKKYTIPATNLSEKRKVTNSNLLLTGKGNVVVDGIERPYVYDGLKGIKTGHTEAAQYCLIENAEKDGLSLISVTLHSTMADQYPDAIKLLDYGFENYTRLSILDNGEEIQDEEAPVKHGSPSRVRLAAAGGLSVLTERSSSGTEKDPSDYRYETQIDSLTAPVKQGSKAGTVTLYEGDTKIGACDLITIESADYSVPYRILLFTGHHWQPLLILFVVAVLILTAKPRAERRRRKRRAERMERRRRREESARRSDEMFGNHQKRE